MVDGDYAYLGLRGNGWRIFDVSDPTAITEVAEDDADDAEDLAVADGVLYVIDADGIRTYDVTDPTSPTVLATQLVLSGTSKEIALRPNVAFVAAANAGLVAVDISTPSAPVELDSLSTSANAVALAVHKKRVYVAHSDGFTIVDSTVPSSLTELGTFDGDRGGSVAVSRRHAFLAGDDTISIDAPTLQIVDVTAPATPVSIDASFNDYDDPVMMRFSNGLVFVSADDDGQVHIIDTCP